MANSSATLTSLWLDEGQGSPMKRSPKTAKTSNVGDVNDEIIKFYKDAGLEPLAKEAGLLDTNGELTSFKSPNTQLKINKNGSMMNGRLANRSSIISYSMGAPMVAIPLTSAATAPTKISPFKNEPAILPKVVHMTSPMILGTPQRLISSPQLTTSSPRTPQNILSGVIDQSGTWSDLRKRTHDYSDTDFSDSKRSKKGDKGGKGLRHFSMKVCEKVQRKGTTSYNEVADELVAEFSDPHRTMSPTDQAYDQKNIRRRVYDALNVLMAMNIISKEKKEIKWLGLPTNSAQECQNLELEKQRRLDRIRHKTQQLQELILQQIAFKNLVQRNKQMELSHGPPTPNSAIHLPFIIVNTSKKTVIDCSISNDKFEYLFNFDNTFEIHDDVEVLKRMGMAFGLEKGQCKPDDLEKSRQMVPKALESYVLQLSQGSSANQNLLKSNKLKSVTPASPLATPLLGQDPTDHEVAMATSRVHTFSRQSSVGSFSDLAPSRADTGTPSEDYSESESARSSPIES